MPAGTTRKKERKHSPERQHVHIENTAGFKEEVKKDEQAIDKMKLLKERYGDGVFKQGKFGKDYEQ